MLLSRSQTAVCSGLVLLSVACGARDEGVEIDRNPPPLPTVGPQYGPDGGVIEETCLEDTDCEFTDLCFPRGCVGGVCEDLPPVVCDDGDACTNAFCDPDTAECIFTRKTFDEDGDGHYAALPGTRPGEPGSCGDDCDDTSDRAFPGGREACDGVDNDCNGVVDDNFTFLPPQSEPRLLSEGSAESGVGGVTHNGQYYGISFNTQTDHDQNQLLGIGDAGDLVVGPVDIALGNSDTYAGPIIWNGRVFATVWEDRRDDNFEIYFNRLDREGNKLGPDVRISNAPDFSLDPDVEYTGSEYVVAWADRRTGRDDFRVFGQRLSREGVLLTEENVDLTPDVSGAESPHLAFSGGRLGMVFNSEMDGQRVVFRALDLDLTPGKMTTLSPAGGVHASVSPNAANFVAVWHSYDRKAGPGDAIWGATITPDAEVIVEARRITEPAPFARGHSLLALGDRLLLLWAEFHDGSYDIYSRFLSPELEPLSEPMRITNAVGNAVSPAATFNSNGDVGILYVDDTSGSPQVFFTSLTCE